LNLKQNSQRLAGCFDHIKVETYLKMTKSNLSHLIKSAISSSHLRQRKV